MSSANYLLIVGLLFAIRADQRKAADDPFWSTIFTVIAVVSLTVSIVERLHH